MNRFSDLNKQGFMKMKEKPVKRPLYIEGVRVDKQGASLYKLTYGALIKYVSGNMKKVREEITSIIVM